MLWILLQNVRFVLQSFENAYSICVVDFTIVGFHLLPSAAAKSSFTAVIAYDYFFFTFFLSFLSSKGKNFEDMSRIWLYNMNNWKE